MPEPRMRVAVTTDRSQTVLEMLPASGVEGRIQLDLSQLDTLIGRLGEARAAMVSNRPVPPIEGVQIRPVYSTRWAVHPEALTEGSVVAFQHPNYGPVGFVLAAPDIEKVVKALTAHLGMVHSSPTTRPS